MQSLKVLDLSHHNLGPHGGPIDFAAIAAFGVRGVILKATQGVRMADPTFSDRRKAALDAGLLVGAYDFNTGDPVKDQVDFFMATVQPDAATLCALDFEDNKASEMTLDQAQEYLELGDAALGRPFWIYSGNRVKDLIVDADDAARDFFAQHPFWLCEYGPHAKMIDRNGHPLPWGQWSLWQFSGDGVNAQGILVPGIIASQAGRVDMNTFNGTDDELAAAWAG